MNIRQAIGKRTPRSIPFVTGNNYVFRCQDIFIGRVKNKSPNYLVIENSIMLNDTGPLYKMLSGDLTNIEFTRMQDDVTINLFLLDWAYKWKWDTNWEELQEKNNSSHSNLIGILGTSTGMSQTPPATPSSSEHPF